MPAKSEKQFKYMQGVASGRISTSAGPSKTVAKEFIKKTPGKKQSLFSKK